MHGESGTADTAPRQLADQLGLHYQHDVQQIMDILARERAVACSEALVTLGVSREQLLVTSKGRGGHIAVDFIPTEEASSLDQIAKGGTSDADNALVPLPMGVPFRMRLKVSGRIIFQGVTGESAEEVQCEEYIVPRSERLFVGQEYIFEALQGPGTEPNSCEFNLDPTEVRESDVIEVKLPVRRVAIGQINVVCSLELPHTYVTAVGDAEAAPLGSKKARGKHWTDTLELPQVVYHVIDEADEVVSTGVVVDPRGGTLLGTYGLQAGTNYRLQVYETGVLAKSPPSATFRLSQADLQLELPVRRRLAEANLEVTSKHRGSQDWRSSLDLPPLFEVSLVHKDLRAVVQSFVVEDSASATYSCALAYEQLFVGETYVLFVSCPPLTQAKVAQRRIDEMHRTSPVEFNDVGDARLPAIEQAWAVMPTFVHSDLIPKRNAAALKEVVRLLTAYPAILIEVVSEIGLPKPARPGLKPKAPDQLAAYYRLHATEDAQVAMDHLPPPPATARHLPPRPVRLNSIKPKQSDLLRQDPALPSLTQPYPALPSHTLPYPALPSHI